MTKSLPVLYYIHDPMCSWCWGFHAVFNELVSRLPEDVSLQYILGGLAADNDQPMAEEMQQFLQQTWHTIIQQIPGTKFNFDFWTQCHPRRSTFPACRAVIAAGKQKLSAASQMTRAIQHAYYLQAKNPSDDGALISLAEELNLDTRKFSHDLNSQETQNILDEQIQFSRQLGVSSFPSLVLQTAHNQHLINIDYLDAGSMLADIKEICLREV